MNQLERALRQVGRIQDAYRVAAIFQRWALRSREKGRLEEHVSHAPDDWEARFKLVNIYLDSGDLGLAQLVYKQIREKMPSDSRIPALGERIARASSGRTIP